MKFSRSDAWAVIVFVALVTLGASLSVGKWVLWIIPLTLALTVRWETVPENQRLVIEIFGAFDRILNPGLHFLTIFEFVRARVKTYEQYMSLEVDKTLTQDDIQVSLKTEIFFQLLKKDERPDPEAVYNAVYGVETADGTIEVAINNFGHATLRNVIGSKSFDWSTDNQQGIDDLVKVNMQDGVNAWGHRIVRHSIKEFIPPASIVRALEAKLDAEKNGAALKATADAERDAQIARAEGAKQATIKAAEAAREEERLDAEGEALGLKLRAEALQVTGGKEAADYNLQEQRIAALREIAKQATTVVITPELANIASLGVAGKTLFENLSKPPAVTS